MTHPTQPETFGKLALAYAGQKLPLRVLHSGAGYYIGTLDEEGPVSRESLEYFGTRNAAQAALESGLWTQLEYA